MKSSPNSRFRPFQLVALMAPVLFLLVPSGRGFAQETEVAEPRTEASETDVSSAAIVDAEFGEAAQTGETAVAGGRSSGESTDLRFNFSGTDWKSVLEWFSEQADLSLQVDQPPLGSFTFSDPSRAYTISEAMDVLNFSLLKRGYALVRRGRMLQVIDLEAENADKLISEIAELVRPEDLEERGKSDIVSSVFPLGSLTPDAAKEELALMKGPWGRVMVLDSARQVKVTETASKLIAIRDMLNSTSVADTNVVEVVLKHRGSEEILEIARPLLEIEPGENSAEGIRISVGPLGDRIFATGLPGKTGLLESIIRKADQPLVMPDAGEGAELVLPTFQTHAITTADSATVFDVLQTLLSGSPDARIAIDPKTNAIVAFARPETHDMIKKSILEMEGNSQDFKVLDLKRLDPAQALLTINKFFGVTADGGEGPIVDGDPATGKLWVRGTSNQIALVEKLLSELEGQDGLGDLSDKVRILPYTGRSAMDALDQVQSLWPVTGRTNRIRTVRPASGFGDAGGSIGGNGGIPERRSVRPIDDDQPNRRPLPPIGSETRIGTENPFQTLVKAPGDDPVLTATEATPVNAPEAATADSATATISVAGGDIVVQMTPAGLLVASDDVEALNAFEALMASLAGPGAIQSDLPTIFWLKYAKADQAAELISKIMGGAESSVSSAVDSMMGGLGGGMLGGLMGLGGGGGGETSSAKSILTSTGSVSMVPDARLNALIVQAGPMDMQMIEMLLEKIDRQESPEDIQTFGSPQLIPVIYQDAKAIAEVVKSAFGDRIAGAEKASSGRGGGGQPSPQDFIQALRGGGRGGGGGGDAAANSEPTKISIAVDAKSNSLVVIATPQDFEDVKSLVTQLDEGGMTTEETISTYTMKGAVNPDVLKIALESILGTQAKSTSSDKPASGASTSTAPSGSSGGAEQSAADIQRRIEFFRSLRGGGGAPGGGQTGGRGGGSPFGGGRGGGGGGRGGR